MKATFKNWLRNHPFVYRFKSYLNYYLRLKYLLPRQLNHKKVSLESISKKGIKCLVPLFETSHYQHFQILILAKALQVRGIDVKILICDEFLDGCELKSIKNEQKDACFECRFNQNKILHLFGLPVIRISEVLDKSMLNKIDQLSSDYNQNYHNTNIIQHGISLNECVNDSVLRYYYGDLPNVDSSFLDVRRKHIKTSLISIETAIQIDKTWKPDVVFNNMTSYSAWEPIFRYFSQRNIFHQISMSEFNFNSIVFDIFNLFPSNKRFNAYKKSRKSQYLTHDENLILNQFLDQRFSGNASIFQKRQFFSHQYYDSNSIVDVLGISNQKRNVFLFSNVFWDVGLSHRGGLYKSVIDWVLRTIELVQSQDNLHLYIKPHPSEVYGTPSRRNVSQIFEDHYPRGLDNVTLIPPSMKIKTYDLFPYIDLGLIFTGTLGLEMMLNGIPVVSTGMTSHFGLGFSPEPTSESEYLQYLSGELKCPKYDVKQLRLFAYFYFIRSLIPWDLTEKVWGDDFDGFTINSLDDLMPHNNALLDHLCSCILDSDNTVPETWPSSTSLSI